MIVYLSLTLITIAFSLFISRIPGEASPVLMLRRRSVFFRKPAAAADLSERIHTGTYRGITRQELLDRICLFGIFISLFLVSALRVNVGNDYMRYVEFMHRANIGAYVATEWGFNFLTWLIYTVSGFENYLAVFAVFAFFTILFFLAAIRHDSEDFTMSFILFMLLGYYFQSISTVRQYLALAMALYSLRFILLPEPLSAVSGSRIRSFLTSKDWPRFLLFVLVGGLFHKSMFLVLILYPLCLIRWRRWMFLLAGLFCLSCVFLKDLYLQAAVFFYPSYAESSLLSGGTSLVSIIRCVAVLGLHLIILGGHPFRTDNGRHSDTGKNSFDGDPRLRFYFMCNLMALALYTFGSFLPMVSRIAYYLTITQILYIPALLHLIAKGSLPERISHIIPVETCCRILKALVIAAGILYFIMYMYHAGDVGIRVLPYQSILFHDLPPTLSESSGGAM